MHDNGESSFWRSRIGGGESSFWRSRIAESGLPVVGRMTNMAGQVDHGF